MLVLMPSTACELLGFGLLSTGHPGTPPVEHGITTGRYTWPQAAQNTIGSTMAARRPAPRAVVKHVRQTGKILSIGEKNSTF